MSMLMKNKLCFACAILISVFLTGCSRDGGALQTKQDEAENESYVCVANVKLEPGKGEEAAGQGKPFASLGMEKHTGLRIIMENNTQIVKRKW